MDQQTKLPLQPHMEEGKALVIAGVLAVVLLWLPPSRAYAHGRPTTAAAPTAYDPWGGR